MPAHESLEEFRLLKNLKYKRNLRVREIRRRGEDSLESIQPTSAANGPR